MSQQLILTDDGSYTLFVPALNEHYHSTHGALQESLHVFIEAGFKYVVKNISQQPLRILEIGFGTGLNALLTFLEAEKEKINIFYEAIEKYPLSLETLQQLNYPTLLNAEILFKTIHTAEWEKEISLKNINGILCKKQIDLLDYQPTQLFDLIYFDAFAPTIQPDLWSEEIFRKLYNKLTFGGALVTYSSKGIVKEALRAVGFRLERLSGAAGKRHMLRAVK